MRRLLKQNNFQFTTMSTLNLLFQIPNRKDEDEDLSVKQPTSLQQRMLAISGQNIDEFMKEMENVQKKKEQERAADLQERLSTLDKDKDSTDNNSECMRKFTQ